MFRPLLGKGGVLLDKSLSVLAEIWGYATGFERTLSTSLEGVLSRQGTAGAMSEEETGVVSPH